MTGEYLRWDEGRDREIYPYHSFKGTVGNTLLSFKVDPIFSFLEARGTQGGPGGPRGKPGKGYPGLPGAPGGPRGPRGPIPHLSGWGC